MAEAVRLDGISVWQRRAQTAWSNLLFIEIGTIPMKSRRLLSL